MSSAESAKQGPASTEIEMEEMESQALVPASDSQEPVRWQRGRLLLLLGMAAVLCASVLLWGVRRRHVTASGDADKEFLSLSGLWRSAGSLAPISPLKLGAGDPVPVRSAHVATEDSAPLRSAKDNYAGEICKDPKPNHVCLSSGQQCQHALFADRQDCSIIAFNVLIAEKDLYFLNDDPKAGEYVPCNVTVNYRQANHVHIVNGRCRYKGSTGSFMGCVDSDGKATTRRKECRAMSMKVKVNKDARTAGANPQKPHKAIGLKEIQLQGMMHDDSLLRTHMGYTIIRDLGLVASCSIPANLYLNGKYHGLMDMVEAVDDIFTKNRFSGDEYHGESTLWKEMWPKSDDPKYYKHVEEIKDFAAQEMKEEGPGGPYYDLFANLYREAEYCAWGPDECTKSRASAILDKYTHAESFIDGILGMTLTANSDQIIILHHNFYFYVYNGRFFYVSWDYNQVLYDITGSPIPGYEVALPWFKILEASEREKYCPYPVPSSSEDMSIKRFNHFTCDPVGHLMGLAWKDRYLQKVKAVDQQALVHKAEKEMKAWSKAIADSVDCDAMNGGWPQSSEKQVEASLPILPMYDQVTGFWKSVAHGTLKQWPSPTYADFPQQTASCFFDGIQVAQYLGQAGVAIVDGVRDCPHGGPARKACSNDISNVIAAYGFVASFLSSMLTECPITDSMGFAQRGTGKLYEDTRKNDCAAQSSRLVAGLASASAGASGLSEMCVPGAARVYRESVHGNQQQYTWLHQPATRRLNSVGFENDRGTEQATCAFDVVGALAYLGRAGTVIDLAIEQCHDFWKTGAKCSADITAVVESFSYAAYFVANSVAQCAEEIHFPMDQAFQATCAADISQLIGGLYSVASGGSGIAASCGKPWPKDPPYSTRILSDGDYHLELEKAKKAWHDFAQGDHRKLRHLVKEQFGSVGSQAHVA